MPPSGRATRLPAPGRHCAERWPAAACSAGEVVDRHPADRLRAEVRLNPGGDLARAGRSLAGRAAAAARGDEVMDVAGVHVADELGEAQLTTVVVESADRHDRIA